MNCLGCGIDLEWLKGFGTVCFTCPCGSTIFVDDRGHALIPISLMRCLAEDRNIPHIDYYVGKSAHVSPEKESFIAMIKGLGAIWSWECPECRQKVLENSRLKAMDRLYPELHPELQRFIEGYEPNRGDNS
ncbi:hypothetical protein ES703_96968 [subsurface metagenome]